MSPVMNVEILLKGLVREVVREEIRPLREELKAIAEAINDLRKVEGARGAEFSTVEEIAAELKVSRGTVRTWIAAGALRASRPGVAGRDGRVFRIARSDLASFLATKQSVPRDDAEIQVQAARIIANVARKGRR
jgi:excisionase family DNA binding protein